MYHDQGHIPMKLIDFEGTVNVSLGMPILRTSVDHGTAFDIAGRNLAGAANMKAAMRLAVKMAMGGKNAGSTAACAGAVQVGNPGARAGNGERA
jgi:4-hydroxy-L-threonine phosphate dehydrogenase PdxA